MAWIALHLAAALDSAAGRFGGIEVLHYSSPGARITETLRSTGALDVTVDNLGPQIECVCYGATTATRAVLPAMLAAGTGTRIAREGWLTTVTATPNPFPGVPDAPLSRWLLTHTEAGSTTWK